MRSKVGKIEIVHGEIEKYGGCQSGIQHDTLSNSKNDGHCMKIVTRREKVLEDAKVVSNKVGWNKVDYGSSPSAPELWLMRNCQKRRR